MPNSLAFRLFASFALWTLLVLPVTAFFLIASFRNEVQLGFDYRLNQYLIYLIDRAYPEQGVEIGAPNLGEPLFSLPFSGLYWQIKPLSSEVGTLYKSESLVTETLKLPSELGIPPDERLIRQASIPGPDNQKLRIIEREVAFQDGELRKIFSFAVAGDTIEIEESVYDFRTTLIINLAILGAGLMLATFIQVRFGLWPLRDISKGLAAIRSGESDRLEGTLPQKSSLCRMNSTRSSSRTTASSSAPAPMSATWPHALKTPLSVIMNEASSENSEFARKVYEQAAMMRQQIDHH
jgi:hypothetical protein